MFLVWFDCCIRYFEVRELIYVELLMKFVYDAKIKVWNLRKKGFVIGRLAFVFFFFGELYFLRVLFNKVRGLKCYVDIKIVDGIV